MTDEPVVRLLGRLPTQTKLPATGQWCDMYAITRGRKCAAWAEWGKWIISDWDAPGMARDHFGVELDDVPEVTL